MRLPHSEYVAALRRNGAGLQAAASLGLDAEVPSCPGWTVADLVDHVGGLYGYVAEIVSTRATEPPDTNRGFDDADRLAALGDVLDELIELLIDDPATPVWNWSAEPDELGFWARRMAHETAVHRVDAQLAHDLPHPIDHDLAADGIDELVDVIAPPRMARSERRHPAGVLVLRDLDDREWRLREGDRRLDRLDRAPDDATVVTGSTSELLLACTGRTPWEALDIAGDAGVLPSWSTTLRF
jgi:uncharacterized protein (TIGR03083 family)